MQHKIKENWKGESKTSRRLKVKTETIIKATLNK